MRALVLDDEVEVRRFVSRVLQVAGYVTEEFSDGIDALYAIASGARFELVVTDVRMPLMSGLFCAYSMGLSPFPASPRHSQEAGRQSRLLFERMGNEFERAADGRAVRLAAEADANRLRRLAFDGEGMA